MMTKGPGILPSFSDGTHLDTAPVIHAAAFNWLGFSSQELLSQSSILLNQSSILLNQSSTSVKVCLKPPPRPGLRDVHGR